jgi:thiamine pyrophosphate-dependent acetolactate synthase large subunit-like protein
LTFNKTNFARIAEDMGALGIRVESAAACPAALSHALAAGRELRRGETMTAALPDLGHIPITRLPGGRITPA